MQRAVEKKKKSKDEETKAPAETSTFDTPDESVPDKQKVKKLRVVASKKSLEAQPVAKQHTGESAKPQVATENEELSKHTQKVMKLQQAVDIQK